MLVLNLYFVHESEFDKTSHAIIILLKCFPSQETIIQIFNMQAGMKNIFLADIRLLACGT